MRLFLIHGPNTTVTGFKLVLKIHVADLFLLLTSRMTIGQDNKLQTS